MGSGSYRLRVLDVPAGILPPGRGSRTPSAGQQRRRREGGRSGVAAAQEAAAAGARVILAESRPTLAAGLPDLPELTVLTRTTVTGYYDHGYVVAVERRTDHLGDRAPAHLSRQRLWHIRAGRIVLATGALERPILFEDNDRPGVMLAGAAAAYPARYGVLPGRRAVVFGCHDGALQAALDLHDSGVALAAVLDARPGPSALHARFHIRGIEVLPGHAVFGVGLLPCRRTPDRSGS
ncbi:MAG: ferredoxin [Actinomycetia bacterium]|nr:ferredoxin [Actinomycetes bacterium]